MENQFKTGLPVAFTKNDGKRIFGRILCNVPEDKENIRCITPHGSIFLVKKDETILDLSENDKDNLINLEKLAMKSNGNIYNTLLDFFESENDIEVK